MRFEGKKALVTGGNSGIGLTTARMLIEEGAEVIITGRDSSTLEAAQESLGPKAIAVKADVSDPEERKNLLDTIQNRFGELDILFANAGIVKQTPAGSGSEKDFEEVLKVNLVGVFSTIQSTLPFLKNGSSIVLNGSIMSVLGAAGSSAYAASKAGVRAMARVLANELGPKGIRVNVVVPGATRTPIWGPEGDATNARLSMIARSIPMGRLGEAEEIAKAVLFLASEDSSYIQGTEIVVDGGSTSLPAGAPIYAGK
ncbi:glucose 1-dehydrogenase [Leptospira wolffii]|uniref:Glucose 1-dehydrogenase n=1 Tax=Leptospira wolffii TaxID=409998 RepID=A0ABV5BM44_9LEPT